MKMFLMFLVLLSAQTTLASASSIAVRAQQIQDLNAPEERFEALKNLFEKANQPISMNDIADETDGLEKNNCQFFVAGRLERYLVFKTIVAVTSGSSDYGPLFPPEEPMMATRVAILLPSQSVANAYWLNSQLSTTSFEITQNNFNVYGPLSVFSFRRNDGLLSIKASVKRSVYSKAYDDYYGYCY